MAQNESTLAMIGQMGQLNESGNEELPRAQQILNLPNLKTNKPNRDETMNTEMEYVNFMKENNFRASVLEDQSFFRSIIKVDKGETQLTDDKASENQALLEINEQ